MLTTPTIMGTDRESEINRLLSQAKTAKNKKKLEKELQFLKVQQKQKEAFSKLSVGMYVYKQQSCDLGKITELQNGDLPIVFVSWNEKVPLPEQPDLLEIDEIANSGIIKPGDLVRVARKENGQIIGSRLDLVVFSQARGWICVED